MRLPAAPWGTCAARLVTAAMIASLLPWASIQQVRATEACATSINNVSLKEVALSKTTGVRGWEPLVVTFAGELTRVDCASDAISVAIPEGLYVADGVFFPKSIEDKEIGKLVIKEGLATLVFNDYGKTHESFLFWLTVQPTEKFPPGTSHTLDWGSGDREIPVTLTMASCPECQEKYTKPTKWSNAVGGPEGRKIISGIESAMAGGDGESITFTDKVGEGFEFDCKSVKVFRGEHRPWGGLNYVEELEAWDLQCNKKSLTASIAVSKMGKNYALYVEGKATKDLSDYQDSGSVKHGNNDPISVSAWAYVRPAGGQGDPLPVATNAGSPGSGQPEPVPTLPEASGPVGHVPSSTPPVVVPVPPSVPPVVVPVPPSTPPPAPVSSHAPEPSLPPRPSPILRPVQVQLTTRVFQVGRYTPRTRSEARVLARLDDDRLLRHREDRALRRAVRRQFVTVAVPVDATAAQLTRAINAQTTRLIGDISTTAKLGSARQGKGYTVAWELSHRASPKAPWARRGDAPQRLFARS